jgi:hypothetical protein
MRISALAGALALLSVSAILPAEGADLSEEKMGVGILPDAGISSVSEVGIDSLSEVGVTSPCAANSFDECICTYSGPFARICDCGCGPIVVYYWCTQMCHR